MIVKFITHFKVQQSALAVNTNNNAGHKDTNSTKLKINTIDHGFLRFSPANILESKVIHFG